MDIGISALQCEHLMVGKKLEALAVVAMAPFVRYLAAATRPQDSEAMLSSMQLSGRALQMNV